MKRFLSAIKSVLGEDADSNYLTYFCPTCREVFEVMFYDPIEEYEGSDAAGEGDLCLIQARA